MNNEFARSQMAKFGWKECVSSLFDNILLYLTLYCSGEGLGLSNSGRSAPIKVTNKQDTQGVRTTSAASNDGN